MKQNIFQAILAMIFLIFFSGCAGYSVPSFYSNGRVLTMLYPGKGGLPLINTTQNTASMISYDEITLTDKKMVLDEKKIFAISYHYWQRANESETLNDWYMARYFCRIAHQLDPDNIEIEAKIATLTEKILIESDAHFQCGFNFYQNKEIEKSRDSFLKALQINPEHGESKRYLVEILQQPEHNAYQVIEKKGLDTIAQEVYEDPEKSFLIAYFNDLKEDGIPEIGSTLTVPPVSIPKPTTGFDLEEHLGKARSFLDSRQYSRALQMVSRIQIHQPECSEALEIENSVYRLIAQEFEKFGKYSEALNVMMNVKTDCQTTQNYIAHLKQLVKDRADIYYRRGVRHFVNEELEKAIVEWKKALAIDPTNTTTQKDIENAENLLEKLRNIQ